VQDYLPTLFPNAERPMLVHRLDRATSGILLVAMNQDIYVALQKQFTARLVKKKYIAVLDGMIDQKSGVINLPLRVDLDNRPQQLVCFEHGLPATTRFEFISKTDGKTRIAFYPITGRTHQLRVHAAHPQGLNTPIVGDDLYGTKSDRLHLHAAFLQFVHPVHREDMEVVCEVPF
jgi:tRNA pseudouridine32 synthase/23S rRNA pseudouridine746 synthase